LNWRAFAPAKVNLFLHVGPPQLDGYHPLCCLMVFADVGDTVAVQPAEQPEFVLDGPFAASLLTEPHNLVQRAADALLSRIPGPKPPFRLILDKRLPIASGLGGGSSDAGATLRLLREALELEVADEALEAVAASLGADGAACLWGKPVIAEAVGDHLTPAPRLPTLEAVLVNPRRPSPTAAVYKAFDAAGARGTADRPGLPDEIETVEELAAMLSYCRNDLEVHAVALEPAIGEVLATLRGEPETLIARMSGSGASCFALCAGDFEAESLAERVEQMRPAWWVRRCRLGAPEL
jgi:4-diphosphocytidyl-2-C-methyl-D-erythritol kinase